METLYWMLEYGKVLFGYLFLMFIWPSVVFRKHLSRKAKSYRFGFCVTVQIVIVNTLVLGLGLFHILEQWIVLAVFYGIFFFSLLRGFSHGGLDRLQQLAGFFLREDFSLADVRAKGKEWLLKLWGKLRPRCWEYLLLLLLLIYGMGYFSYGILQNHAYGFGDLYTHHTWIYGLLEGEIFYEGIYPQAMHCFIYCLNVLLGIRVYSSLLFLGTIQAAALLLAAYFLMREVFCQRCTPLLVLAAFLALDAKCTDAVGSMARFQGTLPQEFGLHTQFLCALYMIRYLKEAGCVKRKGKSIRLCADANLFLFMMSVAASIALHFYTTLMAVLMCASFALFYLKRIFTRERFLPLTAAALSGLVIAAAPMATAYAWGIPFQGSIEWALKVIWNTDMVEGRSEKDITQEKPEENPVQALQTISMSRTRDGMDVYQEQRLMDVLYGRNIMYVSPEQIGTGVGEEEKDGRPWIAQYVDRVPMMIRQKAEILYRKGYLVLGGEERGNWFLGLTVFSIALWLFLQKTDGGMFKRISRGYPPVIFASFLFMLAFMAQDIGLPRLADPVRFCSTEQLLLLMVAAMPADAFLSLLAYACRDYVLQLLSVAGSIGIYVAAIVTGNLHGYLYFELSRYDSAVAVTNSIINMLPQYDYTVVSPTDDRIQVLGYGYHEELLEFVRNCEEEEYYIPTEYVFLYIEKKPLWYGQSCFFQGPSWLAAEKYPALYEKKPMPRESDQEEPVVSQYPEIIASEISEDVQWQEKEYENQWAAYKDPDNRAAIESKAYEWCQRFMESYPLELKVYYEDDEFVCYCFRQEMDSLYNLGQGGIFN